MLKKLMIPLGIVALGLFTIVILVAAKPKPEPRTEEEPALVKVAVVPSRPETAHLSVQAQGSVNPKRQIELLAQVSGEVVSVEPAFVDGGFFDADQVLIRIDDSGYQAALLSARSRVADAEQRLAEERGRSRQAQREWRDLGNQNANELFLRKPQLAAAEANLAAAQGDLRVAELNLQRTQISVPFGGRIRQTQVDLGQYVTTGSQLATVYDSSVVEVRLALTEAQAALINLPLTPHSFAEDQQIPVTITGSVAGDTHQWQGQLVRTDAYVDADSRMYFAVVEVADPFAMHSADGQAGAPLLPGLFVQADIAGKRLDNVLKLPRAALVGRDQLRVLDGDNKVVEQTVRVLRRSESHVWVQADVELGALIALEKQSLTPGGTEVDPVLPDDTAADIVAALDDPAGDDPQPQE